MKTVVIELTNHCNLNCLHCFPHRHGASGFIQKEVVEKILQDARAFGFEHISFTGGEPTLHPQIGEIFELTYQAGYRFGIVSNGWIFPNIYNVLLPYTKKLTAITFSLDGAAEASHDHLRGKGSFNRLMNAISICNTHDIPFTINTVITTINSGEIHKLAAQVMELGSRGLRFGHLLPNSRSINENLVLSIQERKKIEAAIDELGKNLSMPVVMAPGNYTTDLIPCATLKAQEVNVNWQGNVTFCCHLSGLYPENKNDEIGSLLEMSFSKALERVNEKNNRFLKTKISLFAQGALNEADYFPCQYCTRYFNNLTCATEPSQGESQQSLWQTTP